MVVYTPICDVAGRSFLSRALLLLQGTKCTEAPSKLHCRAVYYHVHGGVTRESAMFQGDECLLRQSRPREVREIHVLEVGRPPRERMRVRVPQIPGCLTFIVDSGDAVGP